MVLQPVSIENPVMLHASSIAKRFGSTQALSNANLEVRAGEVHGLLGANGAGKSTLSRIISGHIQRDNGNIIYNDAALEIKSTRDALRSGIVLVAQETSLTPDMTVLENIFLPELGQPGRLSYSNMRTRALEILSWLGHEHILPLDQEVYRLSAAQKQLVEIAKALALNANLVIFDEPTSALSPAEVERLFDIMSRLRENGHGLIFVSHRLEEVFAITDRVTIMREGVTVAQNCETAQLTQTDIIRHMVGKDIGAIYSPRTEASGLHAQAEAVLEVKHLASKPTVKDVSFAVKPGEILGLAGLVGAGRSEAVEALFGLRPRDGGEIYIKGQRVNPRSPAQSIGYGIGLVAEDRRAQNIVPDLSVRENLFLAQMGIHKGFGRGFAAKTEKLEKLLSKLGLPRDRLNTSLLTFSGGMQQKVIIARWLLIDPKILILDEPTKGVDIGTRASIYAILREIAEDGVAVIVISSDFEELLGVSERVVVMSDGLTIADLPASALTEEKLTLLAAPRTSTESNRALLRALSQDYNATTFWALLGDDQIICLALETNADNHEIGLRAGHAADYSDTGIINALRERKSIFVEDNEAKTKTLLVPMQNKRGHDLGWIGISLHQDEPSPNDEEIVRRVNDFTASEVFQGAQ